MVLLEENYALRGQWREDREEVRVPKQWTLNEGPLRNVGRTERAVTSGRKGFSWIRSGSAWRSGWQSCS